MMVHIDKKSDMIPKDLCSTAEPTTILSPEKSSVDLGRMNHPAALWTQSDPSKVAVALDELG